MKKKNITKIILLIIVILLVVGFFVYQTIKSQAKQYEILNISAKDYEYFVFKQDEKFGVIDKNGKIIVNAKYTDVKIPNPLKSVFICYEDEKTIVLNNENKVIYDKFKNIEPLTLKNVSTDLVYEKTVLKYEQDGKYGLISIDGKKITGAKYEEINTLQYKEGELLVKQNEKYGIMNINGYEIIKPEYDKIEADGYYSSKDGYKNDGYIVSNKTNEGYRYGYINNKGQKVLECKYNELKRLQYNKDNIYIKCAENGKYGLYEGNKNIIPNEYQEITYVEDNEFCVVQKGKKYGIIILQGSMMLQVKYLQIDVTGDYIYVTDENSEKKVYDKKGNITEINPNLVVLSTKSEADYKIHIEVVDGQTIYSIYKGEQKLTTDNYSYLEYLFENYFIASNKDGKLGVIDNNGNTKIDIKYDSLQKIADTQVIQATNSISKVTELYNKDMSKVLEVENAVVEKKNNNTIKIYNNDIIQYLDLEGNKLEFKAVFPDYNLFPKKENGKWGFIGQDGNIIIDYKYDDITELNNYGFAGIKKDEKWGVINKEGNIIVDNIYNLNIQETPDFIGEYYKVSYGNGESYYTK